MFIIPRKGLTLDLFLHTIERNTTALHFTMLFLFPRVTEKIIL